MKSSGSVSGHFHAISLSLPVCRRTAQYIICIGMPHFVVCVADIAIPQDKEQTQPIEEAKCCNHQCLHQIIEPCLSVERARPSFQSSLSLANKERKDSS
jgi:hypothetical protein